MNRYAIIGQLGDGSFGVVSKAQNNATGDVVAVKKMKQRFHSWDECLQLREVQSLRKLQHPNVIKLKEVVREHTELFLIFEYCERNVLQIMRERMEVMKGAHAFNEREVRSIMCQTLLGIQAVHKSGFMHRDLKPENLLVRGDCVKVADFGLAKEIRSRPPFTEYVSTRWYRAPEVVLHSHHYNSPVDIWACGAIFAELLLCRPLFPGTSESDQLFKICSVLGTPSPTEWDEGYTLARRLNVRFPAVVPTPLRQLLADAPPAAVELIELMLRFNPSERPTVVQCLQHPFFTSGGGGTTGSALYAGISTGQPHNPFVTPANMATPLATTTATATAATMSSASATATTLAGSPFTGLVSCNATPLSTSTVAMSKYASLFSQGAASPCGPAHSNNSNSSITMAAGGVHMHANGSSSSSHVTAAAVAGGGGGGASMRASTTTVPSLAGGHTLCSSALAPQQRHTPAMGAAAYGAMPASSGNSNHGVVGGGSAESDDEFDF